MAGRPGPGLAGPGRCGKTRARRTAIGYRLVDLLELPREVYFNLPRVVMIGNLQVSVENHQGLVAYDHDGLTLAVEAGRLVIRGQGLTLGTVRRAEVTVSGRIASVQFEAPPALGPA